MDIHQIPTHLIDEDKDQPRYRFDEASLQELAESIRELGLLSPIKVRKTSDNRYKIIYGNRRYKASTMLGLDTIPCILSEATDEMEIYLEQIAENLNREGFTPIEEAEAFEKLLNDPRFTSSVKFLSSKLGKPEAYIKNKLDLLQFGEPVRKLVVSGSAIRKDQLTEEQLLPLKDLPGEYRDSLALIMARDEMPVSDVKKIAKLYKDKEFPESTKGKLLYKTGPGLLETWSAYQQNKKENAAAAAAAEEMVKARETQAPVNEDVQAKEKKSSKKGDISKLIALLDALPAEPEMALGEETEENVEALQEVDALIARLETYLEAWRRARVHLAEGKEPIA